MKNILKNKKYQYTIEEAYTDNYKISQYIDGKYQCSIIKSYWEVDGYCSSLEDMGYSKAYDIEQYKSKLEKARSDFEFALEQYDKARTNPLIIRK